MDEKPWASPDAIRRMTIPQILCAFNAEPPGGAKGKAANYAEYALYLEERRQEEQSWGY